ncbi:hypothetical protein [Kitasatospora albolonga]|uniref:hypothetical protein n=1 Tax=Kitasatospora albolonga TaxID=68173 RepID=UPI0035E81FB0
MAWPDAASPAGRPEPGTPEWDNWEKESIVAGRLAQLSIVQRGEERSRELCDAEWGKLWPEQQAKLDKIAFGSGCILQPPGQ